MRPTTRRSWPPLTAPIPSRVSRLPPSFVCRCRRFSTSEVPRADDPASSGRHLRRDPSLNVFATQYPSGSPSSPLQVLPVLDPRGGPLVPSPGAKRNGDADLLPPAHQRLPDIPNRKPLLFGTFACVAVVWTLFILHTTNAERANSTIVRSLLFTLRNSPLARSALGDNVKGEKGLVVDEVWVDGSINVMQGAVDVAFRVKGSRAAGKVYFTSVRRSKGARFEILRWRLIRDDGAVFDFREEIASRLLVAQAPSVEEVVVSIDLTSDPDDPFALASVEPAGQKSVADTHEPASEAVLAQSQEQRLV